MEERAQFEDVQRMLEKKLQDQIADKRVSLEVDDRGLVIILSDDVLFDSGKAEVKEKASDNQQERFVLKNGDYLRR